jgi:hypothetical protein
LQLIDVNVMVYAFRTDAPDHEAYHEWVHQLVSGNTAYAVSDLILSGFLRIVTHPRVFSPPTPLPAALDFVHAYRDQPTATIIEPGERHWPVFVELCRSASARGNLIPDAYLAALAIESGSEFVTTDRDYARFPNLRWRHPLD